MKVFQVPFCFLPDPIGGTEVYVANLARRLMRAGVDVRVVAPATRSSAYNIGDLDVRRFAVSGAIGDVAELYGDGDRQAADEFMRIVDEQSPDLVHLHAFTPAISLRLVQGCKRRGIPVIFTYHTPTASCQRGTLMLWGESRCDGRLEQARCAACTLQGAGLDRRLAKALGLLPPAVGRSLGKAGVQGSMWTALRMTELIRMRHAAFRKMVAEVDHIVAVCEWVRGVLLANGVPPDKISLSRQGIENIQTQGRASIRPAADGAHRAVRLVFVGRFDPTKGVHILFDALRKAPSLAVTLDIYGVVQSDANAAYSERLLNLAKDDSRIAFHDPVPSWEIVGCLRQYDFLAVPSQWMETGPMVALEAFAAGIPVIGANLGGVAELVQDGINGLLIDANSPDGWLETLRRITEQPELRAALAAGVRPPKSAAAVSTEMLALYRACQRQERTRGSSRCRALQANL